MSRRRKPYDPAAKLEREAEIARLKAMGAEVNQDRGGKVVSARLSNVFNLLHKRGSITTNHFDAAYRLAEDWAAWKGLDGKPEHMGEFVDGGVGCPELVTDRMIQGGMRVAAALYDVSGQSQLILKAFMVATVEEDRPMSWRGIMERLGVHKGRVKVGDDWKDGQVWAMWSALEELRAVFEQPRRAAA